MLDSTWLQMKHQLWKQTSWLIFGPTFHEWCRLATVYMPRFFDCWWFQSKIRSSESLEFFRIAILRKTSKANHHLQWNLSFTLVKKLVAGKSQPKNRWPEIVRLWPPSQRSSDGDALLLTFPKWGDFNRKTFRFANWSIDIDILQINRIMKSDIKNDKANFQMLEHIIWPIFRWAFDIFILWSWKQNLNFASWELHAPLTHQRVVTWGSYVMIDRYDFFTTTNLQLLPLWSKNSQHFIWTSNIYTGRIFRVGGSALIHPTDKLVRVGFLGQVDDVGVTDRSDIAWVSKGVAAPKLLAKTEIFSFGQTSCQTKMLTIPIHFVSPGGFQVVWCCFLQKRHGTFHPTKSSDRTKRFTTVNKTLPDRTVSTDAVGPLGIASPATSLGFAKPSRMFSRMLRAKSTGSWTKNWVTKTMGKVFGWKWKGEKHWKTQFCFLLIFWESHPKKWNGWSRS